MCSTHRLQEADDGVNFCRGDPGVSGEFIWTLAERGAEPFKKGGPETDKWEEPSGRETVYGRRAGSWDVGL